MSEDKFELPPPPAEEVRDRMSEVISVASGALSEIQAAPGEAVEAMSFLIGRIISMASQPGQIEANVESAKASIIASIAGHQRAMFEEGPQGGA